MSNESLNSNEPEASSELVNELGRRAFPKSLSIELFDPPIHLGIYNLVSRALTPAAGDSVYADKANFPGVGQNWVTIQPHQGPVTKGDVWVYEHIADIPYRSLVRLRNIGTNRYLRIDHPDSPNGSLVFADGLAGQSGVDLEMWEIIGGNYGFATRYPGHGGAWISVQPFRDGQPYYKQIDTIGDNFFRSFPEIFVAQIVNAFSFVRVG